MKIRTVFVTLAVMGMASAVSAQESLIDHVVAACEQDLAQYCSQVTPGQGRLLHCVAAHEDKLSGQCNYALYRASSLLEQWSMAIGYVAQSCETEIEDLCSGVRSGEGRILACLKENDEQVGETCKKAIADTVGE